MKPMPLRACASALALTVALGSAGLASAQSTAPAGAKSEIVVTGKVLATAPVAPPLTVTYSEGTITSDQILNAPAAASVSVQTLLNNQPSIFAFTNGALGSSATITYRGFNSGEFAETYDGVALNDLFNGGVNNVADSVNNVQLLPSNIDSVILYRGINNPSVNSYNSLAGTVDFLPKQPSETRGGAIGASYSSFNSSEVHAGFNTGDLDGVRQLVTVSHSESDGWVPNSPEINTNVFYSGVYNAPNQDHLSLVMIYNKNDGDTPFEMPVPLLQQAGGYGAWPTNFAYEHDHNTNFQSIFTFRAPLSSAVTFETKVFGGYSDYNRTSYSNPADQESATQPYLLPNAPTGFNFWVYYPSGPTYDPAALFGSTRAGDAYHFYGYTTWDVGFTPKLTISVPHNTVTVGGNLTYGELHSREYWYGAYAMPQTIGYNDAWDERDSRLMASGYVQDEIKLLDDRLTLTPGVKYLFAATTDSDSVGIYYPYAGTPHSDQSFTAVTIGANYRITDTIAAYAAFGQNIKFPDITAYYDAIPSNALSTPPAQPPITVQPEHVNDYELGVRYQKAGFAGSLALYREDFTNTFIDTYNETLGSTAVTNGGASRYQGVELQLLQDFGQQPWGDLKAYLNYAHNQAQYTKNFSADATGDTESEAGVSVYAGEAVADIPNDLLSLGGVWTYRDWRVNAEGRYVGRQVTNFYSSGTATLNGETSKPINGYFVTDFGVSKTIPLEQLRGWAKSVKISFNVNNLFDTYYYNKAYTDFDHSGNQVLFANPAAPRSISGGIEIQF